MKRYIRLKSGKIYDTTKADDNSNVGKFLRNKNQTGLDIIAESDDILDLIQDGDLVAGYCSTSLQLVDEGLVDLIWDRKENYGVKKPEDLSIYKIYTKQEDDYILVWDKERGVI